MYKILAMLTFMAAVIPGIQAQTATQPDLSGTWKLNAPKSDFGQMPPPSSQTEVITQAADNVTFAIASENDYGNRKYSFSVKTDGADTPFPADAFPADSPFKIVSSQAKWQGASLVLTQKTSFQGDPGTMAATYTLSPDGKVLTEARHISGQMGDIETKAVYDKQ